ncbi:hypothetical protein H2202_005136 [Exophiala xenobiotica]|nr:hypothetical protein H2202_005136 [Exophiala xenobiotica]KAK5233447.1 hypothetical protein LTR47_005540 [Exophiala xenobiotica]KAK5249448.1 hypothetical protein LTS06_005674 [Exophiala xenobiotica]KAK5349253.1 hypothetical protein LTR61_007291 [Exophiala xenobiotica]KAK5365268.1 hypothetical protein LTR11_008678 [Exophiala xenobiotica]
MAEGQNDAWSDGLWQGNYGQEHPQSFPFSAPSSFQNVNPSAAPHYQYGGLPSNDSFSTPRYISEQTLTDQPRMHAYQHEQSYTTSTQYHSYRDRSSDNTLGTNSHPTSTNTSPELAYFSVAIDDQYSALFPEQRESLHASSIRDLDCSLSTSDLVENVAREVSSTRQVAGKDSPGRRLAVKDKLPCYHPDCLGEDGQPRKFFSRKADVTRHYKSQHDITWLDCPWPKCLRKGTQGFPRKDHLTEHQRGYHQEPIPKRIGGNQPGKQAEAIPTSTDEMNAARLSGKPLPTPLPDTVVANKTAREQDSPQEQATGKRRRISQEATHPDLELRGHHTGTKSRRGNKTKDSSPSGAPVVGQHRVQWDEPSAGPVYQEDQRQQQRPALSARRANTQPQTVLQRAATSPAFFAGYHDMEHYVHSSSMPRYYQDSEHPATRFP